jgi:hypothetical protein
MWNLIFKSTPHIFMFIFIFCIFQKFYFFFYFSKLLREFKVILFFHLFVLLDFWVQNNFHERDDFFEDIINFFSSLSLSLKNFWAQMQQFALQCAIMKWEQLTLLASTSFLILIKTLNMKTFFWTIIW